MNHYHYYQHQGEVFVSTKGDLSFPPATASEIAQKNLHFIVDTPLETGRGRFKVTHPGQLGESNRLTTLDLRRIGDFPLDAPLEEALAQGRLSGVSPHRPLGGYHSFPKKSRVHILALGDVGSTLLLGLKLLGGDVISTIGICDLSPTLSARWEFEMEQIASPEGAIMPRVETIGVDQLFQCDMLVFVASKGIPPVGSGVQDVRMAQFQENQAIVTHYARQARRENFSGFWAAVSDPVDPLAKVAYLESNRDENGNFDGKGLSPEQIQGYGLGVMHGRATYYAQRNQDYSAYLEEGRCFGPHGKGLWVANSIEYYNEEISQKLTQDTVTANLKMRELGYKPYVAPALSSGALSLLATLRGQWHYGSVFLEGIYLGVKNRFTPQGLEIEQYPHLPDPLFQHIQDAVDELQSIV